MHSCLYQLHASNFLSTYYMFPSFQASNFLKVALAINDWIT